MDPDLLRCENEGVDLETNRDGLPIKEQPGGDQSDILIPGNALDSCLQPVDLFNELSVEDVESISVAPGEGKRPVSIFHEPLVEAKSFPSLFPNGDHTRC